MKLYPCRSIIILIFLAALSIAVTGCGASGNDSSKPQEVSKTDKVEIIATLFPQYDFAKTLTKDIDNVNIRLLMPPGTEAHNYEPTPKDLADIQNADIFIYTSLVMEPWVEKLLTQIGPNTLIIDATKGVTYMNAKELGLDIHEDTSTGQSDDDDHNGLDPHVWLDPNNAAIMAGNVAKGLEQKLPQNKEMVDKALAAYLNELTQLDQDIQTTLAKYTDRNIIFAGHYAFGYFSKRYGVIYHSPYDGFSPDSEPAPQKIAQMVDLMKAEKQTVVYYEELIDPKIARIIASETGAKLLMLHAAHNISKDDLKQNVTYLEIMNENLAKLEEGLKRDE